MTLWKNATCPECGTSQWSILETREVPQCEAATRRRHLCYNGHRFTTYTNNVNDCLLPVRPKPRRRI